jgi:hypothetical protein
VCTPFSIKPFAVALFAHGNTARVRARTIRDKQGIAVRIVEIGEARVISGPRRGGVTTAEKRPPAAADERHETVAALRRYAEPDL